MKKASLQLPWADLHCHTQASDGSLKPAQLVEMAKARGLKGLSITDHDTPAAYAEAAPVAQNLGIHLGTGIEFSCVFEGHDIHLLGYDFELNAPSIATLCQKHYQRRSHRNLQVLEKLRREGLEITSKELEDLGKRSTVGRPHIAQMMVQKGYVSSIKEAFNRYLGEGKRCYVRGEAFTVDETIDVIHAAHGKAFIAHPHLLPSSFPIEQLLMRPFDGIECWYARISAKKSAAWIKIAKEKGWLMSGGSDFHGVVTPETTLGCSGIDKAAFFEIFEHPIV